MYLLPTHKDTHTIGTLEKYSSTFHMVVMYIYIHIIQFVKCSRLDILMTLVLPYNKYICILRFKHNTFIPTHVHITITAWS